MKKLALILTFAAASSALAAGPVKSEFFFQTAPEKHQVTPDLSYKSQSKKSTGSTEKVTNQVLSAKYEYGINEMFSAGLSVGYLTGETTDTGVAKTSASGLTDVVYFLRGQNAFMEGSSLHYGADINMALAKAEYDSTTNKAKNGSSGGMGMTPYVGYNWIVGPGVVGTKISTELDLSDRTLALKPGTTEVKVKGGNETSLTGFYEQGFDKWLVGGAISYSSVNTTKATVSGSPTNTSGGNYLTLKVYPTYEISETATVIGDLTYSNFLGDEEVSGGTVTKIDSRDDLSLNVGGRFTF